jgi:hypothetical protein
MAPAGAAVSEGNKIMATSNPHRDTSADGPGIISDEARDRRREIDPQKARQGQIILKTPTQRWIFFGALGLAAVLGVVIAMLA